MFSSAVDIAYSLFDISVSEGDFSGSIHFFTIHSWHLRGSSCLPGYKRTVEFLILKALIKLYSGIFCLGK